MTSLRVVAVPYWNIEPFLRALGRNIRCEVARAVPSRLPELWRSGRFDLCMLSVADLLQLRQAPLAGGCIASDGPVGSVFLSSDRPPERWRRVGLDAASRTSAQLARLVARHHLQISSTFLPVEDPDAAYRRRECDAALRIGDRALCAVRQPFHLDLGEAWQELTGLPFVYAAWVPGPRTRRRREELESLLADACEGSAAQTPVAADDGARALGIEPSVLRRYYTEEIRYDLDHRARLGLARFDAMLSALEPAGSHRHAVTADLRQPAGGVA